MSQAVVLNDYVFDKTAKTVTFSDYSSVKLEGVKLITNVTTGTIIYQFNSATKLGTIANNILTLVYDTSAMADTDQLMIIYDPPSGGFFDRVTTLLQYVVEYIRTPPWSTITSLGQKVQVISASDSVIGTVTTVGAVSNLTYFNNIDSRELIWNLWDTEYNTGIRSKIV